MSTVNPPQITPAALEAQRREDASHRPSNEMTGEFLGKLRELAQQALNEPMDPSIPPHERDLVISAQDLMWLLDHVESPLRRAVRIARGELGPPTEPVVFNLRQIAASDIARWDIRCHIVAAADEIERLTGEQAGASRTISVQLDRAQEAERHVERLRAALDRIASECDWGSGFERAAIIARAALSGEYSPPETSGEWRPVSEQLPPETDDEYLVWTSTGCIRTTSGREVCIGWRAAVRDADDPYYTHWRAAPPGPPSKASGEPSK